MQVKDPYRRKDRETPPLKSGLFVEAEITGHTLHDVFLVPRSAVRDGSNVLLIDENNRLRKRPVTVVWSTRDHVVTNDGLSAGDMLCLTRLPVAVDGIHVQPTMVDLPIPSPASKRIEPPLTQGATVPKKGPARLRDVGLVEDLIAETSEAVRRGWPVLRELRTHLADEEELVRRVARQQQAGYRLALGESDGQVVVAAGFRVLENLISGRFLYVDDLVTLASHQGRGMVPG